MFVNTQLFRSAAKYFEKHGEYPYGDEPLKFKKRYKREPLDEELSDGYREYWIEETKRVVNGYSVGGMRITGEHYLYLNYLPIKKTLNKKKGVDGGKGSGDRGAGFPDFWDEDYKYFWTAEIARRGITKKKLEALQRVMDLNLVETDRNLSGGLNHLWLKPRGVGASFKGAMFPIYNQFFVKDSTTFISADTKEFLLKDGIFDKYISYRDDLNRHASGFRRSFTTETKSDLTYECATLDSELGSNIRGGMRSKVIGFVVEGNPEKARGKRGHFVWEEAGTFPALKAAWMKVQPGIEEYGIAFAQQRGFGTGGDDNGHYADLEEMFYDPQAYNIIQFRNIYDKEFYDQPCAYFTPAYVNITQKDTDGNSLVEEAKAELDAERAEKEQASSPDVLLNFKTEKPYNPREALRAKSTTIMPVAEIEAWDAQLAARGLHNTMVQSGMLVEVGGRVEFQVLKDRSIYERYPVGKNDNKLGAIAIVERPYKMTNHLTGNKYTPENLYMIGIDTYRHDESSGASVGSIYVRVHTNRYTPGGGDKIVAWYDGRPTIDQGGQDEFNRIAYLLAEYYNAKIAFENDEPGGIVDYGKRFKKLHYLQPQFELAFDDKIQTKASMNRTFGMHMGSGKDSPRINQGDLYLADWLQRVRSVREDGSKILNLHTIYSRGLLKELKKYERNKFKNFDRVAAMRLLMYFEREFEYNNVAQRQEAVESSYFSNHEFFA